jgi:hypothetical protein
MVENLIREFRVGEAQNQIRIYAINLGLLRGLDLWYGSISYCKLSIWRIDASISARLNHVSVISLAHCVGCRRSTGQSCRFRRVVFSALQDPLQRETG